MSPAKSPAPAPKLRLKWEPDPTGGVRCSLGRAWVTAWTLYGSGKWFINDGDERLTGGDSESLESAQLAAEAAARELAETKLREAEELWPGITKETNDAA